MVFTERLREGVRRGRITCSVRVWTWAHVKVGGRYPMDEGHIVVDSIAPMRLGDITSALARESGFAGVRDLLETARHGRGRQVFLIRFRYLPPGAWDVGPEARADDAARGARVRSPSGERTALLRRIHASAPPGSQKHDGPSRGRARRRP